MAIPAADTDLLIVIRAIQETITDTKIPGTQAETHSGGGMGGSGGGGGICPRAPVEGGRRQDVI